jgi:hypothetical protein
LPISRRKLFVVPPCRNYWEAKIMNWDKLLVIGRDRDSFKALVARKIRERRRDERELAVHRTTKHQLQARNSCVADARSYRIARRLPVPATARFDWKALLRMEGFGRIRSAWLKKFRNQQFRKLWRRALTLTPPGLDRLFQTLHAFFKSRISK